KNLGIWRITSPAAVRYTWAHEGEGRCIFDIDNADVRLIYRTGIGYAANPLVEVINELGATAIHIEAAYCRSKPSVLVELVGPDIGITQKGFGPWHVALCSAAIHN